MSRRDIYYWKCDRPAAFHGTSQRGPMDRQIEGQLEIALRQHFAVDAIELQVATSQGNHLTWLAKVRNRSMFIRVENGPEQDDHLEIESWLMERVRSLGLPIPTVYGCDATRLIVPFAWQALEFFPFPDLNHWYKTGSLDRAVVAFDIGVAVARWQAIESECFGPLDFSSWQTHRQILGFHSSYENYFRLRLDQHLHFLCEKGFITTDQRREFEDAMNANRELLNLERGCLVHKDLALWNILGSENRIAAYIDFDDAIFGDPMDDLSLLGCFHDAAFLDRSLEGYQTVRPLPENYRLRFWLHLLRNMIVKSVIRVGAGYFDRNDGFFLVGSGASGADLRRFTQERLSTALHGLKTNADLTIL